MTTKILQRQALFNAPQARVWEILTQSEFTKQYMFGCEVISDWNVGDAILWKGQTEDGQAIVYVQGTITAIDPGTSVSFTMFDPNMGLEDIPSNYVELTYRLEMQGHQCQLSLAQGDYAQVEKGDQRYADSEKGWDMVIPMMQKVAETS